MRTCYGWGLAALAAMGAAGSSSAGVVADLSLSEFQFQVIDLAPDDGVPAGMTFLPADPGAPVHNLQVDLQRHLDGQSDSVAGPGAQTLSRALDLLPVHVGAGVTPVAGQGLPALHVFGVAGQETDPPQPGLSFTARAAFYFRYDVHGIRMAPKTALQISARLSGSARSQGCDATAPVRTCESLSMEAFIDVFGDPNHHPGSTQSDFESFHRTLGFDGLAAPSTLQVDQVMRVTFINAADSPRDVGVQAYISAVGFAASAVPEPATAWLWGMAGAGAVALRRRAAATSG